MKKKDAIGLGFAMDGIKSAFRSERNLKIHCCIAAIVLVMAGVFRFSINEWVLLVLTIGLVLVAELINTAIEATVDLVCEDVLEGQLKSDGYREKAKLAKDVGAGAVLVAAVVACIVGVVLFLPKILGCIL
jgi:Diacylglycerol kinase